ncbi:hypothetical protein K1719_033542 [Acacia pycnantha]|nr:hypothetical protein K1719_033542 [Acacia pycnantha]
MFCYEEQETEVSTVKYICYQEYKSQLAEKDSDYCVPYDVQGQYGQLLDILEMRYKDDTVARSLTLQNQLKRYPPIPLHAEVKP